MDRDVQASSVFLWLIAHAADAAPILRLNQAVHVGAGKANNGLMFRKYNPGANWSENGRIWYLRTAIAPADLICTKVLVVMPIQRFMNRSAVRSRYQPTAWRSIVFSEFAVALSSADRPFPCIFGVQGYRDDQLRYCFQERFNAEEFGEVLENFVRESRSFGNNTSLILFLRPGEINSLDGYRNEFWSMLSALAAVDRHPWPHEMPKCLEDRDWEFCFAGEPIFVVCNNPAHVLRQSRRSTGLMLTFQPRWVFDNILGTEKSRYRSFASVRARIANYDLTPISPALGAYGQESVREYEQYFLDETNGPTRCPFITLDAKNQVLAT